MGCQSHLRPAGTALSQVISIFLGTTVVRITRVFCCCLFLAKSCLQAEGMQQAKVNMHGGQRANTHVGLWGRWKDPADLCFIASSQAAFS